MVPSSPRPADLAPLLTHLADRADGHERQWRGWRVRPIPGGGNNLLYRAARDEADLAIKFTIRDDRDRAGREHAALTALRLAGLDLAPAPILLERDRYPQPVVVQTWLDGATMDAPPADDAGWDRLLAHFAAIHRVTPAMTPQPLRAAVLTMTSADSGRRQIHLQAARIPPSDRPASLQRLLARLESAAFPAWPPPPLALCHSDPNASNFIRRAGGLASVDWENSGWGDPAFEIADLMAHPAYVGVPADRWDHVIALYADLSENQAAAYRIRVYYTLACVWWVARFARRFYETPRGLDQRLAAPPPDWQADYQAKYERYLALALRLLNDW